MSLLLFEATVWDPVAAAFKTVGVGSSAYSHRSAPRFYQDALMADAQTLAQITRQVWETEDQFGAGRLDLSEVAVSNINGWLDWLAANRCTYGWSGRFLLLDSPDAPYSSAVALASGVVEGAAYPWDRVTFRWRDNAAYLLDKAAQSQKFKGDNALPLGWEGVADLKDRYKPEWWGTCYNVAAPCVNTSKQLFQLSCRSMHGITAGYAKGSKMTTGDGTFTSVTALMASTPADGSFNYCLSSTDPTGPGCYAKVGGILGGAQGGEITFDGYEGATAADRTTARVWARLMAAWGQTSIPSADLAALDTKQPGEVGIWLGTDEAQRRDVANELVEGAGAAIWIDATEQWRIARMEAPAGPAAATFKVFATGTVAEASDGDIIEWEWLNPGDGTANPASACTLNHSRNWTVQGKDALAGIALESTTTTRGQNWLAEEWRTAKAEDASVLTIAPLARQTTEDSLFVSDTVASAEAARRLAMRKVPGPHRARMRVKFGPATAALVDIGRVIAVQLPRFGLQAGELFSVTGIVFDWRRSVADLFLYR